MANPAYGWSAIALQNGNLAFGGEAPGTAGGSIGQVLQIFVGTVTAASSSSPVVVVAPNVTAGSMIVLTPKTPGGTQAGWNITSVTVGTGFSVTFGSSDSTVYNYMILG
jgi:hypothetical protein